MRSITAGLIFGGGCLRARDLLCKMRSSAGSAPRIRLNHFLTQDRERPIACANSRWLHSGCAFRKVRKVQRSTYHCSSIVSPPDYSSRRIPPDLGVGHDIGNHPKVLMLVNSSPLPTIFSPLYPTAEAVGLYGALRKENLSKREVELFRYSCRYFIAFRKVQLLQNTCFTLY